MRFSVIIPTRNRAGALPLSVASVRRQRYPATEFEILVIDNGSTDETRAVVEGLNNSDGKPVRYIYEERPGLHHARHRAAREATGEILAFTDDDADVTEDWLATLDRAYRDGSVGAAGGPIRVRWVAPPPGWIEPLGGFGHLDHGPQYRLLMWPDTIFGGNFSIRRHLVFELGGFNPDTSVEDRLVGDGEMGLCRKLYARGWKIAYAPEALVYHVQNGEGVTLPSMCHRYAQQGRFHAYAEYREKRYSRLGLTLRAVRMSLSGLRQEIQALPLAFVAPQLHHQRRVRAASAFASAGYYLRLSLSRRFQDIVLRDNWIDDV